MAVFQGMVAIVQRDTSAPGLVILPKGWMVARTRGWLKRFRRLRKDYA
jgi:hypothetical protein